MNELLLSFAEFITTPFFRWFCVFISLFLNILRYYNEPQRYSNKKAFSGLTYRWHMYVIAVIGCLSYSFFIMVLWFDIPFTTLLPDSWPLYLFIISLGFITQIAIDGKPIRNTGEFQPPPKYMLPDKYRLILAYLTVIMNSVVLLQSYIYYGIRNINKKTILSIYILERFGGWYTNNKTYFIYEWSGIIDVFLSIYIFYLQKNFIACNYDLPPSWNF